MQFLWRVLPSLLCVLPITCAIPQVVVKSDVIPEEEIVAILQQYDTEVHEYCNRQVQANWNVATDTENVEFQNEQNEASLAYAKFRNDYYELYFKTAMVENYQNESVRKQLVLLKDRGIAALPVVTLEDFNKVMRRMDSTYQLAEICPYSNQNCSAEDSKWTLTPEMEEVMANSNDYEELLYVWSRWREESGKKIRTDYKQYVDYVNEAATLNGYSDHGEMWRARYDNPDLRGTLERLWTEVEPLYDELHTYVRYKLLEHYGDKMDRDNKMIPAHVLGNMWGETWIHLYDRIKPFPDASTVDITSEMKEMGFSARKIFELSDEFYQSLGLPSSAMSYGPKAVIEKPAQKIVCHPSAWDFCDGEDFRIKMCTNVNKEDFVTIHHEMGHVMYYILYRDQPQLFKTGATPAFHEAVGDTIALSVSTPKHLQKIGLLTGYTDSEADNINALFEAALERIAFLPFGYLVDQWRWDVFSGAINESDWNRHWWTLREKYQKVYAPVARTEEDFDPGAKYHIPGNAQFIAYFLAYVLEFQFYRSLCIESEQYDPNNSTSSPLNKCDFYNSRAAGDKLREGLSLGYSEDWRSTLEKLTGEREISAQALHEYFAPLQTFLIEQNKKFKNAEMEAIIERYNEQYSVACNRQVKAQFAMQVDVGNTTLQQELAQILKENTQFVLENFNKYFADVDISYYEKPIIRRQLEYLTQISVNRLSSDDFNALNSALGRMQSIYSSTLICPYDQQNCTSGTMSLDPDLYGVMADSLDYDELLYVWKEWREKTGRFMKNDYAQYVHLMNKAAGIAGFDDMGDLWKQAFEQDGFVDSMKRLWVELKPFYDELHKYVRRKLLTLYEDKMDKSNPNIPAHLLGNMWAQSWVNLYERIKPFENASDLDITKALVAKNYTIKQLFEISNDFYVGLGLPDNSMSYDEARGALIEKPSDRTVTCHASAWDFCDRQDFRIKMCTRMNMEDFVTIHHEMGHINYYILYKDQPVALRAGANPGFHEAVGDTIALSVATPKHFNKIGLLEEYTDSYENDINALFQKALDRVAFLPFGLLIDMWRWEVFSGKVEFSDWNKRWWELREEYQKISAPLDRDLDAFDPGSKYHIPFDSQYISYFIAHILDMQLHKTLCQVAGEYEPNNSNKPLHKCDIDGSTAAGDHIRVGLSLGRSVHWTEALREMTGETELKTDALLEYYRPLHEFLKEENAKADHDSGATAALSLVLIAAMSGLHILRLLLIDTWMHLLL
ncbi:angiotensin-converting enzyme-like isoform X2 [Malaya genurostris]|uniref:angiotensin-converting enzyme-like isoform X2 n=1 Tax=Malaya genurostris TaxID=325434 RepID=UPI0026F3EDAC|nr:angiotensin-converting enzyme-like isoform X2 [Malaya genurostris]